MDWISKIISSLKIPIKVLLPSVWMFSFFILFLPENLMLKLQLSQIREEYATSLGLTLVISSCFIFVYVLFFLKEKLGGLFFRLTYKYKTLIMMKHFSEAEFHLILQLYKRPDYTDTIDYADPTVKAMIGKKFIFVGNNAPVEMGWDNELWTKGALQPFVRETIAWVYSGTQKKIAKLEKKKNKISKADKLKKINKDLDELYVIESNLRR